MKEPESIRDVLDAPVVDEPASYDDGGPGTAGAGTAGGGTAAIAAAGREPQTPVQPASGVEDAGASDPQGHQEAAATAPIGSGAPHGDGVPTTGQSATAQAATQAATEPATRPRNDEAGRPTPLFGGQEADELRRRWETVQAGFVDEPRRAVEQADGLVADVMQQLASGFARERSSLEGQWNQGSEVSTEDLRQALRRYRSFFDRLLSI